MALNKNYLQLEFGTGLFFDYSGAEKEGYEKHTSTKGNVSYRKYYKDGVKGVLESVSIYDGKFGTQISMIIKDGDEIYYTPVDVYSQGGSVDNNYAESLIKLLPLLEKGQNVVVRGYNFTPDGERYAKIGISITANGEKLKSTLTYSHTNKEGKFVEGDIPALVWVEKLGKKKPSAVSVEAKDDYLLKVLQDQTERLKWLQGETVESVPPQTTESASTFDNSKGIVADQLPF